VRLTTLHRRNKLVTKNLTEPRTWTDSLDLVRLSMDVSFLKHVTQVAANVIYWHGTHETRHTRIFLLHICTTLFEALNLNLV
jgi:hypothetical protein